MSDTVKMSWADELKNEGVMHRGFGLLPKFAMCDHSLPLTAKAIYAYLCSLSGNGETAFPGRDTILSRLGIGKKCYYNHMNTLKEQGYISVERAPSVHGQFAHNIYYIKSNPKKFSEQYVSAGNSKSILYYQGIKRAGFGVIPRAVMMDERLNVLAKGIYSYFASFAAVGEAAFPEVKTILYHLNINETTYRKYLKSLVETNYLIIKQRYENFRLGVNDYILVDSPDESSVEKKSYSPKPTYVINTKIKTSGQTEKNGGGKESLAVQGLNDQSVTKEDMVKGDTAATPMGQTATDQSVIKEDMVKEDMVGEDVVEEPVVEEPVVEEPVADQTVVREPVVKQDVVGEDAIKIRSSNTSYNKTSSSENQSIYPPGQQSIQAIDGLSKKKLKEMILKELGIYSALSEGENTPPQALEIQQLVELVVDTIKIKSPSIRIGKTERSRQDVVETLLGLTKEHYLYVLKSLQNVTNPIKNPVQYRLAALYNAATTYDGGKGTNSGKKSIEWMREYIKQRDMDP